MAPPLLLAGYGSPWASMSSGPVSPIRMGRPYSSTTPPFPVARAHQLGEPLVHRSAGPTLSQPHSTPNEHTHPRGSSQSPLEPPMDPAAQFVRHGLAPSLRSSATSATVSSKSSTLSSSVATPSSSYASLGPTDDVRSRRSLPPIATVGLEPLAHSELSDSGGAGKFGASNPVPNPHPLPHPLHSPFLSASSSGKPHAIRAWLYDSGVTPLGLADGSGMAQTLP